MKGADDKHPRRKDGQLYRLNTISAWRSFKRHVPFLKDCEMRDRLSIVYHPSCWQKYVVNTAREPALSSQRDVGLDEARKLFFKHVDTVIFREHEIRSLQSLLDDYKRIISDYGCAVGDMKSSYLKEILVAEYKDSIGFKERKEKNRSEWVYDSVGGGDYIQAAIQALGISDEQLVQNIATRLNKEIKGTKTVPWPPDIEHLEQSEEISPLLLRLLTLMKNPGKTTTDISHTTLSLATMLTYHVSGNRTSTAISMGVNVHGLTRSRCLTDLLHKSGACVSYSDVQFLYDFWSLQDAESSSDCPQE